MIKKKAKKKAAAAKKSAKKKNGPKKEKQTHPAEVRKDISLMVEEEATSMAKAVIDAGKAGQLAQVKYLLELAKIFPAATDEGQGTPEGDSLAKTLLNRLNIPDVPIMHDENGELVKVAALEEHVGEKGSCNASAAGDASVDSVLASAEGKSS